MKFITSRDDYKALVDSYPGIFRKARTGSAKSAHRAMCLICVSGSRKEIKDCPTKNCPCWPYRFGKGFEDPGLYLPEKDPKKVARGHANADAIHESNGND